MKLPARNGRGGTPRNPRITPEAKAEHDLMQSLLCKLGQSALTQNRIAFEHTLPLVAGGRMAKVVGADEHTPTIVVDARVRVRVNPLSGAVVGLVF